MANIQTLGIWERLKDTDLSLDEKLLTTAKHVYPSLSFAEAKPLILNDLDINEYEYYTKNISRSLKRHIEYYIFPEYNLNDGGHGIDHIKEVIRRSFALNDTYKLGLDHDLIYTIAACHDNGKFLGHEIHEQIAAGRFMSDEFFATLFTNAERQIIKEAIEDHRSSKEDEPRSIYGKLISSADRNTTIEIVFIRSFYVALERMPEMKLPEYLDYTINRLRKKYDEENPENMFFEDEIYREFIKDMRDLLSKPEDFKKKYLAVNNVDNINQTVREAHESRQPLSK